MLDRFLFPAGLAGSLCLLGAAEELPQAVNWANLSAVGILGAVTLYLVTKTIPGMARDFAATMSSWEQLRHTDHVTLEKTLRDLAVNCEANRQIRQP